MDHRKKEAAPLISQNDRYAVQSDMEARAPEQTNAQPAAADASMLKTLESPQAGAATAVRLTHTNTHGHTSISHENLALMDHSSKAHLVMLGPDGDDAQSPRSRPERPDFKAECQTVVRTS